MRRINEDARRVLETAEIDGNYVRLPNLDRRTYAKVDKVLQLLGGKWNGNRKIRAHVFPATRRRR
jgi:hypothetical protein